MSWFLVSFQLTVYSIAQQFQARWGGSGGMGASLIWGATRAREEVGESGSSRNDTFSLIPSFENFPGRLTGDQAAYQKVSTKCFTYHAHSST